MSKKLFRIGDICRTNKSYNPTTDYICKIIEILDEDDIKHYEYNVITGQGDSNSKLKLKLKVIGNIISSNYYDCDFKLLEEDINLILIFNNMHNVSIIDVNSYIEKSIKKINNIEQNISFLKKNRNREDKLESLLEN